MSHRLLPYYICGIYRSQSTLNYSPDYIYHVELIRRNLCPHKQETQSQPTHSIKFLHRLVVAYGRVLWALVYCAVSRLFCAVAVRLCSGHFRIWHAFYGVERARVQLGSAKIISLFGPLCARGLDEIPVWLTIAAESTFLRAIIEPMHTRGI